MTSDDQEHDKSATGRIRRLPRDVGRGAEWLFLDFPYLLFQPGEGLFWRGLRTLAVAMPRRLLRLAWWLIRAFFRWQRPFWVWLARVTGLTALGRVYVQLEKPARIIFWVPVMLTNALLQDIIGPLLPILLVVVVFIYFNRYLIREVEPSPVDPPAGRHPN